MSSDTYEPIIIHSNSSTGESQAKRRKSAQQAPPEPEPSEAFRLAHLRFCQLCRAAYFRAQAEQEKVEREAAPQSEAAA